MNLGMPELVLIGAIALLLFGPKRLPDLARSIGGSIRALKEGLKDGLSETDKKDPS
ncbi:MAG: twin-arginine translocase TatA/TatE family subunit [Elusimicrobia bacterium]|nr:twin-arginine translocase TatA/TatE family subunit [Elusimicrobiota bacterium]